MMLFTVCCLFLFLSAALPLQAQSWSFIDDDEASFTVGGLRYAPDEEGTVAECRGFAEGHQASTVNIPATVTHGGHSYRVVSIGEHAFDSAPVTSVTLSEGLRVVRLSAFLNSALTDVTVPASVTIIEPCAFLTNTMTEARLLSETLELGEIVFGGAMQRLYLSATTPPVLNNFLAFDPVTLQMPLIRIYVPQGCADAYLAHEWWGQHVILDGGEECTLAATTERAGTLASAIRAQGVNIRGIHHLIVTGPMNGDDIRFIRDSLTNIISLDMSQAVISRLPDEAFQGCRFSSIKLTGTLREIGEAAFSVCTNLEELVIPEGVVSVDKMVYNCQNLRSLDLPSTLVSAKQVLTAFNLDEEKTYQCTITCRSFFPPKTGGDAIYTFGITDIRLRVPAVSANAYAEAPGWIDLPQETISDRPAQITVVDEEKLITDALPSDYRPDLSIENYGGNSFGRLTVAGSQPLNAGQFSAYADLYSARAYGGDYIGTLLAEAPMTAESVRVDFDLDEGHWYFLSFPFDVRLQDVTTDKDIRHWVVRTYNGANRAAMRGEQWQDVPYGSTLQAHHGYIWFVANTENPEEYHLDDLRVSIKATDNTINNLFEREDVSTPLMDYAATYEHNAGWNLIGNPYPCYYRIGALKQQMPITVKSSDYSYEQYRTLSPIDDADALLSPYQAFFIQKPAGVSALVFGAEGRLASKSSYARATTPGSHATENGNRQVINLVLTANGMEDYTRVVLNPDAKTGYERERDAAKFFAESEQVPQLYTFIGSEPCAINERPEADGTVRMGVRTAAATICVLGIANVTQHSTLNAQQILLEDRMTGTLTDLTKESYTFLSAAGRDDSRFVLHMGASATGIQYVAMPSQQIGRPAFTLQGLPLGGSYKGIVIENGKLTIKR